MPAERARERDRERWSSTLADLHTSFGTPKASNQQSRLFLEGKIKRTRNYRLFYPANLHREAQRISLFGWEKKKKIQKRKEKTSWPKFVTSRKASSSTNPNEPCKMKRIQQQRHRPQPPRRREILLRMASD